MKAAREARNLAQSIIEAHYSLSMGSQAALKALKKMAESDERQSTLLKSALNSLAANNEKLGREFLDAREIEQRAHLLAKIECGAAIKRADEAAFRFQVLKTEMADVNQELAAHELLRERQEKQITQSKVNKPPE